MNDGMLRIFHALPYSCRTLAASLHGVRLNRWRYGKDTTRFIDQALERETWTEDQWASWREEELRRVLHNAATKVPYYQRYWRHRCSGSQRLWESLQEWPILEKSELRENPRGFLSDDCSPEKLYRQSTSGTTGTPLSLWESRHTSRQWYALCELRWRRWYGVSRNDRWAILGGQAICPIRRRRPPFWVWNAGLNQLYMSSFHLATDLIPAYLDALARYKITYLYGYSSALHELARTVLRQGRGDLHMTVVVCNAEPVYEHQRETIAEAFRCPVRETYGSSEQVVAASECQAGRLHLWPTLGVVEVMNDDQPVAAGNCGDFVCTGFLNRDMPLIRYRIGDRGALADSSAPCGCGRSLPMIESIEGRIDDVLYTRDGRRVGRLDLVFKSDLPIHEAQIIQESLDRIRLRYVPSDTFDSVHERKLVARVQKYLGDVRVELESVEQVPRNSRGKFRAVVCCLPDTVRDSMRKEVTPK